MPLPSFENGRPQCCISARRNIQWCVEIELEEHGMPPGLRSVQMAKVRSLLVGGNIHVDSSALAVACLLFEVEESQ